MNVPLRLPQTAEPTACIQLTAQEVTLALNAGLCSTCYRVGDRGALHGTHHPEISLRQRETKRTFPVAAGASVRPRQRCNVAAAVRYPPCDTWVSDAAYAWCEPASQVMASGYQRADTRGAGSTWHVPLPQLHKGVLSELALTARLC